LSQNVQAKFLGAGVDVVDIVDSREDAVDRRDDAAL
jgi:hypothetical protein